MSGQRFYARENPDGDAWWVMDSRPGSPLSVSEHTTEGEARAEADHRNAEG